MPTEVPIDIGFVATFPSQNTLQCQWKPLTECDCSITICGANIIMYVSRNLVDTFTGDGLGHILCSVQHRCLLQIVMQAPTCARPSRPQRRPPTHLRPQLSAAFPLQLESSDSATQLAGSIPTNTALQLQRPHSRPHHRRDDRDEDGHDAGVTSRQQL